MFGRTVKQSEVDALEEQAKVNAEEKEKARAGSTW